MKQMRKHDAQVQAPPRLKAVHGFGPNDPNGGSLGLGRVDRKRRKMLRFARMSRMLGLLSVTASMQCFQLCPT